MSGNSTIAGWAAGLAVLASLAAGLAADTAAQLRDEATLVAVLRSDAERADKAMACKELAIRGSGAAVPALAPLLADERLASWARIALEAIPDPACDAALREAARDGKVTGRLLAGVINSIGVRRDPAAVDLLAKRLGDADAAVAAAAAVALGRIGDGAATAALRTALAEGPAGVRPTVAEGLVLCAERGLEQGRAADAAALYDLVRAADVPAQRVIEATRGAILARGDAGVPLLLEQLRSPERRRLNIGLSVARELPGAAADAAIAGEFAAAPEPRAALLATVLADRGGGPARAALAAAVAAPTTPPAVRLAAVRGLGRVGDATSVAALLPLLAGGDADAAAAAVAALGDLRGTGVDDAMVRRLGAASGPEQAALLRVIGRRRIALPLQEMERLVIANDEAVSLAAFEALGATADLEGLKLLVSEVLAPRSPKRGAAALPALRAAAVRMPDREACADTLARSLTSGDDASRVAVLDILGEMGGPRALAAVAAAAGSGDPQLQDAGTRLLGGWMTPDASEPLLALSASLPPGKFRTRAYRSYLRMARQFAASDAERLAMCRRALELAGGADDRRQVLEALRLVPSVDGLRLAVAAATDEVLNDARTTAAAILQKIGEPGAEVWELAGKLGLKQAQVEIVQATYGSKDKQKDVTDMVRKRVAGVSVIALGSPSYDSSFGGDPAPGEEKTLVIRYVLDGRPGEATFAKDAAIVLPAPPAAAP